MALHVDLPLLVDQTAGAPPPSGATAPRPAPGPLPGDLRLGARATLLGSADEEGGGAVLALSGAVWVPSGASGQYAGDDAVRARVQVVVDGEGKRLFGAFVVGIRTRPGAELAGGLPTRVGDALVAGASGGMYVDRRRATALGAEITAESTFGGGAMLFDPRASVAHVLLTGYRRLEGGPIEFGVAFGPGLGQGLGSADLRVLALVGFAPERPVPPPDGDDDGVPDRQDACLDLSGEPNADPLLHGCPEPARDQDGDAIPDETDACPRVAGEPTGLRRTHGCPRPVDADGDGVVDAADACPQEKGEPPPAGDGCPARAPPPSAAVEAREIVLSEQVRFETGTAVLRPESDAILAEVARTLREHPHIELVEVQGHTDETGTGELNRRLGAERAERVVRWLVEHGISEGRLRARGYGSDRPIADNTTEAGRAKNRRVEFHIVKVQAREPPQGEGGAGAPHREPGDGGNVDAGPPDGAAADAPRGPEGAP